MCLQEKVEEISEQSFSSGVDPYQIKDGCVDDISLWPPVEYGNVHNYLIKTPGPYSIEELEAYKSLEAYNYYIK